MIDVLLAIVGVSAVLLVCGIIAEYMPESWACKLIKTLGGSCDEGERD